MRWLKGIASCFLLLGTACSHQTKPIDVEKFLQDFIGADLAMSPTTATQTGFHNYEGVNLDSILEDFSEKGIRGYRILYNTMHLSADKLDSSKLSPEVRADFDLIRKYCEEQLFELDTLQTYRHNPTLYVELIGQALNGPFTLEYAPLPARMEQLIARLNRIPGFLDTAKANLTDAPEIWNKVAQAENEGNIRLIDTQIRAAVPASLKSKYGAAAGSAIRALQRFNEWLRTGLIQLQSDWRLGHDLYRKKFALQLDLNQTPEQTLAAANAKLDELRAQMRGEARKLWPEFYGKRPVPDDTNAVVSAVLGKIAEQHTTPEHFFDAAKQDLQDATQFVRDHHLLTLPPLNNLQVIPTPEFMRGVYGVAGFQQAPPLEPKLGAFFWITPFTPQMPKQDVESKLREYNNYGLKTVVIHEGMPGHFVQAQFANEVEGPSRAVLRQLLGNGPYVEGWAVYATQLLIEQGFDPSPQMKLTFDKQMLRVIANAILDIQMQTGGMTDAQALDLMMGQTFQEREEAVAKVQRAKLTSCQLPTYFVGWQAWLKLRSDWQGKAGAQGSLRQFHDAALREGALPMAALSRMMLK
jgi:uncharacterized protein (DUF885 family)